MVQIVHMWRDAYYGSVAVNRFSPYIEIHKVERTVHGNGVDIKVWGEMKIAAGEYVYARELKLNTLQVLLLTPELLAPDGHGYMVHKRIFNKGAYDNYASVDVYDDAAEWQGPGVGPVDGSIWVNFVAEGE
jgi:hypothetical protein